MSAYGIVIENGCYGMKKGSQFQPLSNCTFRFLTPVLAGPMSGYLARAVHKDGNAKEFFYPKGNMARTKVEHFVSILNLHNETNFFKRFTVQMTSTQLDALPAELENSVQIPETIPRAVSLVGKNTTPENEEIWVLKPDLFIDARGHLVAPRDHSLCWIGNLVKDTGNNVAKKDRVADVHLPLTTYYFDLACHFLRGDMLSAVSKDDNLEHCLDEVLHDCEIPQESLEDEAEANGNFLPTFFTAAMSLIIAHYDKWQMLVGSGPLPAALGEPDSGKSTACKLALAATGGWKNNFFASVSEKVVGKVASQTTMGFVIDDPTKPQDVGEAAKKFFNDGNNINCRDDWSPKCCPLFSINNHVLDWLSKPDRERLLSRIIFVPFENIQRSITEEQSALWQQIFDHLISKVSAVVGKVIAMGQWLSSNEGRETFNKCLGIVMQELTSALSEEEVINFFMHVIAPHVLKYQKPALHVRSANLGSPTGQLPSKGKEDFVNRLKSKLEFVVKEAPKEQNLQFLRTDCTTSKLSGDGSQEGALAIRAEPFQEWCLHTGMMRVL